MFEVDLASPRCEADGCAKQPSFGYPGERRQRRCKAHALEAMVRMLAQGTCMTIRTADRRCSLRQEDIKNRKCEADGCAKQPVFGFPGERPRRCKAHALEAMVRVLPRRTAP